MSLDPLHELHHRRASRNIGLLVVLLAFVAIVFGLSVVKMQRGNLMEAFDHQPRSSILPRDPDAKPRAPRTPADGVPQGQSTPAAEIEEITP